MLIRIIVFCCIPFLANAQIINTKVHNKTCDNLLHQLGNSQMKFLFCVTVHSVPVTMCNGCKLEHDDMLETYDKLTQSCNTTFFDKDRINLVPTTENALTGLWTKAYCDDCFNNNNSATFEELNENFYGCLIINHDKPCENCKNVYTDLNNFYISLDLHNNGEVCFDIQDSMNRTRYKWSKELLCCVRQYNVLYFSIALGITTFITLMFYCSTYLLTKRQERNHGTLNDEDPLFNSLSSSSSATIASQLNISNNPAQINRLPPNIENNNVPSATTSQTYGTQKVSKTYEEQNLESSDDEPLTKIPSTTLKEKFK